jgi:hypothetical protein
MFAAQGAFAPYRLWLARMERTPGKFYYPASPVESVPISTLATSGQPVRGTDSVGAADLPGDYVSQPGETDRIRLSPKWGETDRWVGYGYIAGSTLAAALARVVG